MRPQSTRLACERDRFASLPSPLVKVVMVLFAITQAGNLYAQDDSVALRDSNNQDLLRAEADAFDAAARRVNPSVVQVETFFASVADSQQGQRGAGIVASRPVTGTVVGDDGLIVSSLHAFRRTPTSILVVLPDGERVPAELLARDFSREIVLLRVDRSLPTVRAAAANSVAVGQWAIALGKTFSAENASRSVGIVSALGRAYGKAVQTDAKVSPINYGGPLVNIDGEVIGILSALLPGEFLQSGNTELYDSGIGFAVHLDDILQRIPTLIGGKDIHSGLLGIVPKVQDDLAGPVIVGGATPGSPAGKAGMLAGDRILFANGKPIEILAHLKHALGVLDAEQEIELTLRRLGKEMQVTARLTKEIPVYRKRELGLYLSPAKKPLQASRVVRSVLPGSPADSAGFVAGDELLSIDGQSFAKLADIRLALSVAELDESIEVELRRDSKTQTISLTPREWEPSVFEHLPASAFPTDDDSTLRVKHETIRLANFPNAVEAIVPTTIPKSAPIGLVVAFGQPGEIDIETLQSTWGDFCSSQGWAVAVIMPAKKTAWSREEVELASRAVTTLEELYPLDPTRIVFAGTGIGGQLALAAASESKRAAGVLTFGTQIKRFGVRSANRPDSTLDFLFVGEPERLTVLAERLNKLGYAAATLPFGEMPTNSWNVAPNEQIHAWLEGLGRL
ncbi:MAG TPA: hypothetical protein DDW52_03710 [Planctomycetaceae bacterium]|nr:hypothetical protein [Planctomycetaceae bacterium]